ncbi:MAG: pilus assembly protein [Magnetovibrio sp.]|nr:pilus assembly protein [Magnetovibrio sp.]
MTNVKTQTPGKIELLSDKRNLLSVKRNLPSVKRNLGAKTLVKRFVCNDRASIAVMFALMLPVILGVVGLGVEAGMWFKDRRELQTIADAAVISAAIENSYGASNAEYTSAATVEANLNGFNAATDSFTSVGTPLTGAYLGNSDYIEVVLNRNLTTIISQVFYSFDPTTTARAVATTTGDKEACVLALSTTARPGVKMSSNSTVNMTDCGVVSNSTQSAYSVQVCNNCNLATDCVWAAGGIDDGLSSITSTDCSQPISNANPVLDPYASLDVPASFGICDSATSMSGSPYTISSDTT